MCTQVASAVPFTTYTAPHSAFEQAAFVNIVEHFSFEIIVFIVIIRENFYGINKFFKNESARCGFAYADYFAWQINNGIRSCLDLNFLINRIFRRLFA